MLIQNGSNVFSEINGRYPLHLIFRSVDDGNFERVQPKDPVHRYTYSTVSNSRTLCAYFFWEIFKKTVFFYFKNSHERSFAKKVHMKKCAFIKKNL